MSAVKPLIRLSACEVEVAQCNTVHAIRWNLKSCTATLQVYRGWVLDSHKKGHIFGATFDHQISDYI